MRVRIHRRGVLKGATIVDQLTKAPKCYRFSRIPFALPPTGSRRFKRPIPLPLDFSYGTEESPGQYDTRPSSICPQLPTRSGTLVSRGEEDCLQCNIWVPIGQPPEHGWPVFFYIHGGFLQTGSNNSVDPSALLNETDVKCIIVSPGYRLGILGFLASRELSGHDGKESNFGLWDQRLALEWTYENVEFFGGDKYNMTVGGLSAGAYATWHQVAYDIGPHAEKQIIRKIFLWSNGGGVEPKRLPEVQDQFENLLSVLQIPTTLSTSQKLEALRSLDAHKLVSAVAAMKQKFFRPILDGHFMAEDMYPAIFNGTLGARMKELGITAMVGDLTQEHHLYKNVFPPHSYETLVDRLSWDYPRHISEAVCKVYASTDQLQPRTKSAWKDLFGKIYADMQIHSSMRGLVQGLSFNLPLSSIHRYRIDWRASAVDKMLPRELGATHGTDMAIWFFGNGETLTDPEKEIIRKWLNPVVAFIKGEVFAWGTKSIQEVRYLTSNGRIEIREDDIWDEKLRIWDITKESTSTRHLNQHSKL